MRGLINNQNDDPVNKNPGKIKNDNREFPTQFDFKGVKNVFTKRPSKNLKTKQYFYLKCLVMKIKHHTAFML